MPAQRTTAVSDARRSAYPGIAGVPPWAAVAIAIAGTLLGVAIEAGSGHRELGASFAACYVLGCVGAVLAVRQSGIFAAVIQPPLLLFVAVPLAYFLFRGEELSGLKGLLISCGYPLIERFPLMLFTALAVLVIGVARRYIPSQPFAEGEPTGDPGDDGAGTGLLGGLAARLFNRADAAEEGRPRHGIDRSGAGTRASRRSRDRGDSRERPARSHRGERIAPDQPRRQSARRPVRPSAEGPGERSRQRPVRDPGRGESPRGAGREERDGYAPRHARGADAPPLTGYEPRRGYEPRDYEPRDYEPRDYGPRSYEPRGREPRRGYEPRRSGDPRRGHQPDPNPPRRRPEPTTRRGERDHHPVSRVRYRGSEPDRPEYPDHPPRRDR